MSSEQRILHEIVKASDAIRRKHRMLKQGKEAIETSMKEVFKPIITPLQEMADRTSAQPNSVKEESSSIKQELPAEEKEELFSIQQELPAEEEEEASTMREEDDLMSFHSTSENTFPIFTTSSPILQKKSDNLSNYLKMLSKNQTSTLDTVYGVRSLTSGLKIGDKPISFVDDKIRVGNEQYEKTPGLIELLFKKRPEIGLVKESDTKNYQQIVRNSNAHRKNYKFNSSLRKGTEPKVADYLYPLMGDKSGQGLLNVVSNAPINYVYWDDPNELVERLRLLAASRAAGSNSHVNEINSIIEELREAEIIY